MFVDHENVCVVYNSVFSNTTRMDEYVSEDDDIIIVIYDEVDLENELNEELEVNGIEYELRFVSSTIVWMINGNGMGAYIHVTEATCIHHGGS